MYIASKKQIVWTNAAWGAPTVEDHRVALSSGKVVRLNFYASVCWATGACGLMDLNCFRTNAAVQDWKLTALTSDSVPPRHMIIWMTGQHGDFQGALYHRCYAASELTCMLSCTGQSVP